LGGPSFAALKFPGRNSLKANTELNTHGFIPNGSKRMKKCTHKVYTRITYLCGKIQQ
jgi:hypothetical protein